MHSNTEQSIIHLDNVTVGYGSQVILSDLNLKIAAGASLLIQGPNGIGKTTLARLLLQLIPPLSGSLKCSYQRAGYVPQQHTFDRQFPLTLYNLVAMGQKPGYFLPSKPPATAKPSAVKSSAVKSSTAKSSTATAKYLGRKFSKADQQEKIMALLASFNLTEKKDLYFGRLSGGQMQRALIARALLREPDFLILDEPFSHLDRQGQIEISQFLSEKNQKEKITICMIDHFADRQASDGEHYYTDILQIEQGDIHLQNLTSRGN